MRTEQEKKERKTPVNNPPLPTDVFIHCIWLYCPDSVFVIGLCAQPPLLPDLLQIFTSGRTAGGFEGIMGLECLPCS